ncbi:transposase InsO family protein [Streptomyces sp. CZ24]|nr:transposase InsO family protein [Streptomyces sp. CZ24]
MLNHKRVARIMRTFGIEGVRLRRRHRTTVPDPAAAKAPDLIGRDFTARIPNTKYVGDITYLPVEGGKFCSWPPSSTSPRDVWPAGPSPTTCARTS